MTQEKQRSPIFESEAAQTYFEEVRFDGAAVFAPLLHDGGVQQVSGGDAGICHSLVVAEQPEKDVGDGVLWLQGWRGMGWTGWCLTSAWNSTFLQNKSFDFSHRGT